MSDTRFDKTIIEKRGTATGFIFFLALILVLTSYPYGFAQDDQSSQSDQSGSTQTDKSAQTSDTQDEKDKKDNEEVKSESTEESTEPKTETQDLKDLFEKMKKMGPGKRSLKLVPKAKKQQAEEKSEPTGQSPDFVGPVPPGETKKPKEFIGPELPDIRLPPIEGEEEPSLLEFEETQPPEGRKYVDFSADKISQDKLKHLVKLEGNSRLIYEDVTILSEFAEFDDEKEYGKFWGSSGVLADNDDGIMKCDTLEVNFKEKTSYIHQNIEIFVFGRKYEDKLAEDAPRKERVKRALGQDDTTVYCDEATYDWGNKIFNGWVEKSDKVQILQEGRHAYAKAIYHEKQTELTVLEKNVELWQKDGKWLFDRNVVKDKEDKWANALLRPETTVTCNIMESDGNKEITTLEGNVIAVQKDKKGSADKVINDDKEQILTAEGNVKAHQENGDWLIQNKIVDPKEETEDTLKDLKKPADGKADKFKLWTEKKDFEAEGNLKVWQDNQEMTADKADYKKAQDRLMAYGNVKILRKDKDDMASDKLLMWLTTKVYEAFGNVMSNKKVDIEEERQKAKDEKSKQESGGTQGNK